LLRFTGSGLSPDYITCTVLAHPLALSYHAIGQFSILLSVRHPALRLLVWHRRGHDLTAHAQEHFRLPELLGKLFREVMRQVGEIIFAEPGDKEISCNDIVDISIRIAQRVVERQAIHLAILVADLMW